MTEGRGSEREARRGYVRKRHSRGYSVSLSYEISLHGIEIEHRQESFPNASQRKWREGGESRVLVPRFYLNCVKCGVEKLKNEKKISVL